MRARPDSHLSKVATAYAWVVKMDDDTNLPVRDEKGEYITTKTAGMPGTQVDVIRAVQAQNIFMVHVIDGIDMININTKGMEHLLKFLKVTSGRPWTVWLSTSSAPDTVSKRYLCVKH